MRTLLAVILLCTAGGVAAESVTFIVVRDPSLLLSSPPSNAAAYLAARMPEQDAIYLFVADPFKPYLDSAVKPSQRPHLIDRALAFVQADATVSPAQGIDNVLIQKYTALVERKKRDGAIISITYLGQPPATDPRGFFERLLEKVAQVLIAPFDLLLTALNLSGALLYRFALKLWNDILQP